jgi:hypothetical protein
MDKKRPFRIDLPMIWQRLTRQIAYVNRQYKELLSKTAPVTVEPQFGQKR